MRCNSVAQKGANMQNATVTVNIPVNASNAAAVRTALSAAVSSIVGTLCPTVNAQACAVQVCDSEGMDIFVNSNKYNTEIVDSEGRTEHTCEDLFGRFSEEFAAKVQHDEVNMDCDPVHVYMRNGAYVAWYDCEHMKGYIA
jgi:hypothetical protein